MYSLTVNAGNDYTNNGHIIGITTDLTLKNGATFMDKWKQLQFSGSQKVERFMDASAYSEFHLMSSPISDLDIEDSFQGSYAYRYVGTEYQKHLCI